MNLYKHLYEAIQRWKADRTASSRRVNIGGVIRRSGRPDLNLLAFKKDPWVHGAVTAVARAVASIPIKVRTFHGDDIETGPPVDILKNPNPHRAWQEFIQTAIINLIMTGDMYITIEAPDLLDHHELFNIPPDKMSAVAGDDFGVAGWKYKDGAKEFDYDIADVCDGHLANPYDSVYGLSPIEASLQRILLMFYVAEQHKTLFKNKGVPSGVLSTEQQMDEEECLKFAKLWDEIYGGEEEFSTAVLANGLKYNPISPGIKDMMYPELRIACREDILAALLIPPFIVGVLDHSNYSNSANGVRLFYSGTVVPYTNLLLSALNAKLPEKLGIEFEYYADYDAVHQLQENANEKQKRITGYAGGPVLTPNEGRELLGMEPVEGGDILRTQQPAVALSIMDTTGAVLGKGLPFMELASVVDDPLRIADRITRSDGAEESATEDDVTYAKFAKRLEASEKTFEKMMCQYWQAEMVRVLANIDKVTLGYRAMLARYVVRDDIDPQDIDSIFNKGAETEILKKDARPIVERTMSDQFDNVASEYGIDVVFDLTNPRVGTLIEEGLNQLHNVSDHSYKAIKSIIKSGYENGDSIGTIKDAIAQKMQSWYKPKAGEIDTLYRAKRVARTEMTKYVNGGTHEAYFDAGITVKKWIATRDNNTRDSHQLIDQQEVPMDQSFLLEGGALKFPGDPGGPASEVVNCRCTLIAVIQEEG